MNIGFIGTGLLGFPMAKRVIDSGYQLIAYNRTYEKSEPLKNYGASVKKDVNDLIKISDVIILVLSDFQAIKECILTNPASLKNKAVIQMSTISPKESILLQEKINEIGGEYIEAPVLGSRPEAEKGSLKVMVGSSESLFTKYENVLKCFTEKPMYIGEVGKASALKLALNQLIASLTNAFSLSLGIIQNSGIEVELFMDVLRNSALYAPTFDKKLDKMLNRNFDNANFPTKHLLKDVNLILDTANGLNINTSMLNGVKATIEKAISEGLSEKDYSAIYNSVVPENKAY